MFGWYKFFHIVNENLSFTYPLDDDGCQQYMMVDSIDDKQIARIDRNLKSK